MIDFYSYEFWGQDFLGKKKESPELILNPLACSCDFFFASVANVYDYVVGHGTGEALPKTTTKKTNIMNTVSRIAEKAFSADTKALIEAGYLDKSLELTGYGRDVLESVVFEANKAALVEAAKEEIKEAKAKK